MTLPKTIDQIFSLANSHSLYKNLIVQLNNDLHYANVDLQFSEEILPSSLKLILQEEVFSLIQNRFSDYLNLLYIVDVSETKISVLNHEDTLRLSESVTFLILQREWQKVWLKAKFRN